MAKTTTLLLIVFLIAGVAGLSLPTSAHAASCEDVVGQWTWFVGGEVTIKSDGTFTQQSGNSGTWECTDPARGGVTLRWRQGGFGNQLALSEDGRGLSSTDPSQSFVTAKRIGAPSSTTRLPTPAPRATGEERNHPDKIPPAIAPPSTDASSSDYELFRKGRDLAATGKCREAIPYFDQAIAANPRYSKAYSDRGRCLASLGQRDRGLQDLDKSVRLAPNDVGSYLHRAGLRADGGDGEGALDDLDQSISIDPMNPASRGARAGLFEVAGRSREAQLDREIAYRQIDTLKSSKRPVLDHVLKSWRAKSVRLTTNVPQESKDPMQAAFDAVGAGKYRTALAVLDAALRTHPGDDTLLWVKGRLHQEIGQAAQAVEALTVILQRHPSAHVFTLRGLAYRQLCRFRDEMADYDRAVGLDPQFAQAYFERGFTKMYYQKGNDPAPEFTKVIELEPQNWLAYYLRGHEYGYWFNKLPKAMADYRRVVELKPDFARAYCDMAFALSEAGRKKEVATWLQKCFTLDPTERAVAKTAFAKIKAKEEQAARDMEAMRRWNGSPSSSSSDSPSSGSSSGGGCSYTSYGACNAEKAGDRWAADRIERGTASGSEKAWFGG